MKSGFIAVMGRPNAGKSTLINTMVGEKVSIVSHKPQTTRNKILGIMNGEGYQAIFIDTPGLHKAKNALSEYMMKSAESALEGVDAVIYTVACDKGVDKYDKERIARIAASTTPVIVALNKCDITDRQIVPQRIAELGEIADISAVMPISARTGKGVDMLVNALVGLLPEGDKYFDDDAYTDKSLRFMASEIIREKSLYHLSEEVPYGIGVSINKFGVNERGVTEIDADIVCEKKAHKPIVIGKGGAMLKKIASAARYELEKLVDGKVYLTLWVRVKEDWRDSGFMLNQLGYNPKDIG
ncbi:MAG: GTPase Era [Clostridia bacterium]|nr:GTPase Era [Clostridia bacterium]